MNCLEVAVLAALAFATSSLAQLQCGQCASPSLRNRWYLTRLPIIPSGMNFSDSCFNEPLKEQGIVPCASSSCMEMLLVVEDQFAMVRGCYKNFFTDAPIVSSTNSCSYTTDDARQITIPATATIPAYTTRGATLLRLCSFGYTKDPSMPQAYPQYCNWFFGRQDSAQQFTESFNTCVLEEKRLTCLECDSKVENCGRDASRTCKGVFCAKYEGTLEGASVVQRGCVSVNPYVNDTCMWMVSSSSGSGSLAFHARQKRASSNYTNQGTSCLCRSDYCNGSSKVAVPFALLLLVFLFFS